MNISHAPIIDEKHCLTFSFIASLKTTRRVKEASLAKVFASGVTDFFIQLDRAVLGERYVGLTGASLPSSFSIFAGDDVRLWRLQADIAIPLAFEYHKFCAVATSTWKSSRVGGEDFFISSRPFDASGLRRGAGDEPAAVRRGWWQRTFGVGGD